MQRKYTLCSPNCTYAAIVDTNKRSYIYFRPEALNTELKNRKTGKIVRRFF